MSPHPNLPPQAGEGKFILKIIFIDRDSVINVDLGGYVTRREDFRFEAGAVSAMKKLCKKGYGIIVISNQAGVGDGVFSYEKLQEVHQFMLEDLRQNGVTVLGAYYCLHGKQAGCSCRKPKTGLFEQAAGDFYFVPAETYFIGDKIADIEAGKKFGLKTVLVRTGYGRTAEKKLKGAAAPDHVSESLKTAVDGIF